MTGSSHVLELEYRFVPDGAPGTPVGDHQFEFSKATGAGSAIAAGSDVYWDETTNLATTLPDRRDGGPSLGPPERKPLLGECQRDARESDTTVRVQGSLRWHAVNLGPSWLPVANEVDRHAIRQLLGDIFSRWITGAGLQGPTDLDDFSRQLSSSLADAWVQEQVGRSAQRAGASAIDPLVLLLAAEDPDLFALPLETVAWVRPGSPACRQDELVMARRSPRVRGRSLVVDSDLRVLLIVNDYADSPTISRAAKLTTELKQKFPPGASSSAVTVTLAENEPWAAVQDKLADSDYNIIIYVGHIAFQLPKEQALKLGLRSDRQGYLTFGGRAQEKEEQPVHPATVAKAVGALPDVRCVLLLGCSTWETVAREFIEVGVPVVIGSHFIIDPCEIGVFGARGFLEELAATGLVDRAFLALRRGLVDGAKEAKLSDPERYRAWLALHVFGD